MKKLIFVILAVGGLFTANAQQEVQFSQNRFLNTALNPAASGIRGTTCFSMIARQQWIGFEGRPTSAMLMFESALPRINSGFGGVLVFDEIGFERNIFFKGNYAYHFLLANGAKLGVGIDAGIISKQFGGQLLAANMLDPQLVNLLAGTKENSINIDLGAGAFYYTEKLYFGVSGQKLVPQSINWGTGEPQIRPHTYFMGGYNYAINANFDLKPSFLVKTDFTSTQVDFNLMAEFKKMVWAGASYRIQDAIVVNAGYNIPVKSLPAPIKVGIAYDFTTQNLRNSGVFENPVTGEVIKSDNRSIGAAEIYLGYCFLQPEKPNFDHYVDPLFLNN